MHVRQAGVPQAQHLADLLHEALAWGKKRADKANL
jgi:hypothetical protein